MAGIHDPRHSIQLTRSYQELDEASKRKMMELYQHYFFELQEDFWRTQGLAKLPALKDATDMLICAEDLGMVPKCVPGVLQELNILGLRIQRMPADASIEFADVARYDYLTVASPSTHDMPPIRAWWEKDLARSQRFYNHVLHKKGGAPFFCEPWVATEILEQHLRSPSMWTVFPIQDLLAIDGKLRRLNPFDEHINDPSNPKQVWNYRLHINLEDLIKHERFSQTLKAQISGAGRAPSY